MPLRDAQKRWRAERREKKQSETYGFFIVSAGAVLCAGLCGYLSPVEHYCISLVAVTLAMIIATRLAGGHRMEGPLAAVELILGLVYMEVSADLFTMVPLAAGLKYWAFSIAAAVAAGVWAFHTIGHDPGDAGAAERRKKANVAVAAACALLWIPAAHYIPRYY